MFRLISQEKSSYLSLTNLVILFSFLCLMTLSCEKKTHRFKIEKTEDNVEIVLNNDIPLYSSDENRLELRYLFHIGEEEGDDRYLLNRPEVTGVDSNGNIYISDGGNHRFLVYDHTGHYINSFGRQGQGPGEFSSQYPVCMNDSANILIAFEREKTQYQILDTQGNFINAIRTARLPLSVSLVVLPDNNFLSLEVSFCEDLKTRNTRVANFKFNGELNNEFYYHEMSQNEYLDNWSSRACMAVNSNGLIYVPALEADKYEILVYRSNGTLVKKIRCEAKLQPYSASELERLRKRYEQSGQTLGVKFTIPEYRPKIKQLKIDDKDRLWVFTGYYDFEQETFINSIDIFDREGRYRYQLKCKSINPYGYIHQDRYYQQRTSSDEYPRIEVYQIIDNL